jgi:hypothetical protein
MPFLDPFLWFKIRQGSVNALGIHVHIAGWIDQIYHVFLTINR